MAVCAEAKRKKECVGDREMLGNQRIEEERVGSRVAPCSGDVTSVVGRRGWQKTSRRVPPHSQTRKADCAGRKGFAIKTLLFLRGIIKTQWLQSIRLDDADRLKSICSENNPVFYMCKSVCSKLQNSAFTCSTQTADVKGKLHKQEFVHFCEDAHQSSPVISRAFHHF